MSLEILIKKVEDSLKNKQLMTVLKYLAEIRNRYPLNKRVEEYISLKKKKYTLQLKIANEIVDLQKQINKENFIKTIKYCFLLVSLDIKAMRKIRKMYLEKSFL